MLLLRQLAISQKCSQEDIATILKTQQSEVSKMMNGYRKITDEHIELLIKRFGKNVVDAYTVDDNIIDITKLPQARQVQATILPTETIEDVRAEIELEESVPIIPEGIANQANCNIKEYIEENEDELERINPSKILGSADLAERVLSTSMIPTFTPGDIIFTKFIRNKDQIIDGKIYYFDMRTLPTMIRKAKVVGDGKIRLVALHPDFGDIVVNKNDILNVGKIIGMLRMTFGDQYAELEALRTKKEQQIDNLITEISKAGSRADRLMEQNAELIRKLLEK